MRRINPLYTLRTHLGQQVIEAAQKGDTHRSRHSASCFRRHFSIDRARQHGARRHHPAHTPFVSLVHPDGSGCPDCWI